MKKIITTINNVRGIGYLAGISIASIPVAVGQAVNAKILKSFT